MAFDPIETAPKDERVFLFVPAFGPWNASWWPGSWSWAREQWAIHTPFGTDKAVFAVDMPQPTHWMPLPPAPPAESSLQDPPAALVAALAALEGARSLAYNRGWKGLARRWELPPSLPAHWKKRHPPAKTSTA